MTAEPPTDPPPETPRLPRDRAYWGMTITQFLGAFNDNLFKQLVLLLCVDSKLRGGADYQPVATALFAIPFVLFSGIAGFLSDRHSKRTTVVLCKVAEIAVMGAGMAAFLAGGDDLQWLLLLLMVVLFVMSTQSAFFGPSKYGILPELFRERDLPAVNGSVQMTTFVSIIFGMALAGIVKQEFEGRLWVVSLICIGIAVAGTLTSLIIRRTPVAQPGLKFQSSSIFINRETRRMLRADRELFGVLLVSSLFWFAGGAVQQAVNVFGKDQMNFGDGRTSLMAACMGVGIAIGCVVSAKASHRRINFRLVTIGGWGITGCMLATALVGQMFAPLEQTPDAEPILELLWPRYSGEWAARLTLTGLGVFAGLFVVPMQVFMQARPPEDQKGRMIGAMNLINWIGIVLSALFYFLAAKICELLSAPSSAVFLVLALVMLPVALFYRPRMNEPV